MNFHMERQEQLLLQCAPINMRFMSKKIAIEMAVFPKKMKKALARSMLVSSIIKFCRIVGMANAAESKFVIPFVCNWGLESLAFRNRSGRQNSGQSKKVLTPMPYIYNFASSYKRTPEV